MVSYAQFVKIFKTSFLTMAFGTLQAAIVLPEQSVASERDGLAVNKKGLTLRELLQQTSHHNAKIRRGILLQCSLFFMRYY